MMTGQVTLELGLVAALRSGSFDLHDCCRDLAFESRQ